MVAEVTVAHIAGTAPVDSETIGTDDGIHYYLEDPDDNDTAFVYVLEQELKNEIDLSDSNFSSLETEYRNINAEFPDTPPDSTFQFSATEANKADQDSNTTPPADPALGQTLTTEKDARTQNLFESTLQSYIQSLGSLPVFSPDEELAAFKSYVALKQNLLQALCDHETATEALLHTISDCTRSGKVFHSFFSLSVQDTESRTSVLQTIQQNTNQMQQLCNENLLLKAHLETGDATCDSVEMAQSIEQNKARIRDFICSLPIRTEQIRNCTTGILSDSSVLPPETGEQKALLTSIQNLHEQHERCRNTIVTHNLRMVLSVIKKLKIKHMDISDQFQEGCTSLLNAIDSFNPDLGFKLSTTAWRAVQRQIITSAYTESKVTRIAPYTASLLQLMHNAENTLSVKLGREATPAELAVSLDMPEKKVRALKKIAHSLSASFSIDQVNSGDYTNTASLELPDTSANMHEPIDSDLPAQIFAVAHKFLDARSFAMLQMRFKEGATLEKIGKAFRVTKERARQILKEALDKTKKHYFKSYESSLQLSLEQNEPIEKKSQLFDLFYAALSSTDRPPATMRTLEQYAGDKNFWHCFFESNDNYVKFFRARLAIGEGFSLDKLSLERQEIFKTYLDERVPTLTAIHKDRAFASILQVPRATRAIQHAMVEKGWRSPELPPGAQLTVGRNDLSPYIDPRVVTPAQITKNLDRFLKEHYQTLEDLHQTGPGMKMITRLLGVPTTAMSEVATYCVRNGGPLSPVMPQTLPATRGRQLSFYLRPEIVGKAQAYHNAGRWVAHHIGYLHKIRPQLPVLRTLLHTTDFSSQAAPGRFKSPAEVGKELVRRQWLDPHLPAEGHGLQTTKSICCNPAITGSEEIAARNRAIILGAPDAELPSSTNNTP